MNAGKFLELFAFKNMEIEDDFKTRSYYGVTLLCDIHDRRAGTFFESAIFSADEQSVELRLYAKFDDAHPVLTVPFVLGVPK